ncbi:MAG TPA: helix-turn-helix transcriptional regulator [Caulobacteraceae bacterium]|nr:helix-turn-helix transcriptional regulator [Caulobacteraceae bacterium]
MLRRRSGHERSGRRCRQHRRGRWRADQICRRLLGMSQAELAWVLDVAPGRVDQIERGARRPSAATLAKTAETLGTTVDSLLGEDPDEVLPSALATQGGGFW